MVCLLGSRSNIWYNGFRTWNSGIGLILRSYPLDLRLSVLRCLVKETDKKNFQL